MLAVPQRGQIAADLADAGFDGFADRFLDPTLQVAGHGAEQQAEDTAVHRFQRGLRTAFADVDPGLRDVDHLAAVQEQIATLATIDGDRLALDQEITAGRDFRFRQCALHVGGTLLGLAEMDMGAELKVFRLQFATGSGELRTHFPAGIGKIRADLVTDRRVLGGRRRRGEREQAGQQQWHDEVVGTQVAHVGFST